MSKLDNYKAFVTVLDAGSLTVAADRLHLSVSAVSKKLATLEQNLGATLIDRSTRSLAATSRGLRFYDHCLEILHAVQQAEEEVSRSEDEPTGILKISLPQILICGEYMQAISDFLGENPLVGIDLQISNAIANLYAEHLDFAFRVGAGSDTRLERLKLADSTRRICCSPDYLKRIGQPAKLQDLGRYRLILPSYRDLSEAKPLLKLLGQNNLSRNDTIDDGLAYFHAIQVGMGIGIMQGVIAAPAIASGSLVELFPGSLTAKCHVDLVFKKQSHSALRMKAFKDFMVKRFVPEGSSQK